MSEPKITFVVAVAENGVIGKDGRLPWHVSSDLKLFKRLTTGKPVIMGRRTWEGLHVQPLPNRDNIVVTRNASFAAAGATVVGSLDAALALGKRLAAEKGADEVAIIGGGEIFAEALRRDLVNRIYLTRIALSPEGDTHMPPLPDMVWREVAREPFPRGERDDAPFTLVTLDRRTP
ncbi:MAG: dihydrofolate reductase [Hyphomicrobiales bacterium]